ncbi:MAG: MMPL family transporter [Actinomycetota bacterium]
MTLLYRLGLFTARRKWLIIAIWIVAAAALFPLTSKLTGNLSNGGFEVAGSQSDNVKIFKEKNFKSQFNLTDLVVFHSDRLTASDPEFRSAVLKISEALRRAPGVAEVTDPYQQPERSISKDGHTVIASAGLTDTQDQALAHSEEVERIVADAAKGLPVEARLTGFAPFYAEFSRTTEHDLARAERIALPITLVILLGAFGSLLAAGMPIALALLSLAVSFGLISFMGSQTTVSLFTQNIASMIGIGVGIDYSLFILTRHRQELRAGRPVPEAIAHSMATSGKAVFVSALTVVVSLSGTSLVNLAAFRSMGWGAMIAVAVAAGAALTLLPALLALLGHKLEWMSFMKVKSAENGWWHRWSAFIMRRPWQALTASLVVIGILAAPALNLRLGSSGPGILPADSSPRVALKQVADAFGEGTSGPVEVLIQDPRGVGGTGFADVWKLARRIAQDPEVERVASIATLAPSSSAEEARAALASPMGAKFAAGLISTDGKATILSVSTKHGSESEPVAKFVQRLRDNLGDWLLPFVFGSVGGDPALTYDINNEVQGKLPLVVGMVLALSFLLLMVFLRSLLLPLKAIIMNMASVLASYGLLVFVFQQGHGEKLLGFSSIGIIESFIPLFMFTTLFGLSMDYEVFLLARIKEEYQRTGDTTEAVGWGLEHTGRIITSAAAVMVTVFGAFAFASLLPVKAMGFGLAAAVFLDATIIRIVMVPATMRLMGKWNWWLPRWLDDMLPAVSVEGPSPTPNPELAAAAKV